MKPNTRKALFCLAASALLLSACDESDLEEQHQQALDDAVAAQNAEPAIVPVEGDGDGDTGDGSTTAATDGGSDGVDGGTDGATGPTDGDDGSTDSQTPADVDLADYTLIFSDEFQGASVDASKWKTAYDWGDDFVVFEQQQHYADIQNEPDFSHQPFVFDGEMLSIIAQPTTAVDNDRANGQAWISGVLNSSELFSTTYGYLEARVSVDAITGAWPSINLLAQTAEGQLPEIYLMEFNGAKPDSVFHNYNYRNAEGQLLTAGQREVNVGGFSAGFHTISARWEPGEIVYYVNGSPTYRVVGEDVASEPMYLTMSLAVGGVWVDSADTAVAPIVFDIDYVRVWQKNSP